MLRSSILLCLFCSCFAGNLPAQEAPKKSEQKSKFFADADAGFLYVPEYIGIILRHAALGCGYRFNDLHGVGLELRTTDVYANYDHQSASGLGALYRLTYRGLYAKTTIGLVLNSQHEVYESPLRYDATGGGIYQSTTLGYRFRSGIILGLTGSIFKDRNFDRSLFMLDPSVEDIGVFPFYDVREAPPGAGVFVPDGTDQSSFISITLTVGYAFPNRSNKWKKRSDY